MNHEYLLEFLEKKDIPIVHKLRHAYLTMDWISKILMY